MIGNGDHVFEDDGAGDVCWACGEKPGHPCHLPPNEVSDIAEAGWALAERMLLDPT